MQIFLKLIPTITILIAALKPLNSGNILLNMASTDGEYVGGSDLRQTSGHELAHTNGWGLESNADWYGSSNAESGRFANILSDIGWDTNIGSYGSSGGNSFNTMDSYSEGNSFAEIMNQSSETEYKERMNFRGLDFPIVGLWVGHGFVSVTRDTPEGAKNILLEAFGGVKNVPSAFRDDKGNIIKPIEMTIPGQQNKEYGFTLGAYNFGDEGIWDTIVGGTLTPALNNEKKYTDTGNFASRVIDQTNKSDSVVVRNYYDYAGKSKEELFPYPNLISNMLDIGVNSNTFAVQKLCSGKLCGDYSDIGKWFTPGYEKTFVREPTSFEVTGNGLLNNYSTNLISITEQNSKNGKN